MGLRGRGRLGRRRGMGEVDIVQDGYGRLDLPKVMVVELVLD